MNTDEWHRFKREIYQKTLGVIFREMKRVAQVGEVMRCGDGVTRIIFPGIPIHSMDLEETWAFTGCRSLNAKFPCPRCLVPNAEQQNYSTSHPLRTSATMQKVYRDAKDLRTKTEANQLLMDNGLNDVEVIFEFLALLIYIEYFFLIELFLGFSPFGSLQERFI